MGKNDKIATFFDGRINQRPFYKKKVVVTGHTGFKGSWLTLWLSNLGAKVHGISLDIPTNPSNLYDFMSLPKACTIELSLMLFTLKTQACPIG